MRAAAASALGDDVAMWVFAATQQLGLNDYSNQSRLSAAQQHLKCRAQQATQQLTDAVQHQNLSQRPHVTRKPSSSSSSGESMGADAAAAQEAACQGTREPAAAFDEAYVAADGLGSTDDPDAMHFGGQLPRQRNDSPQHRLDRHADALQETALAADQHHNIVAGSAGDQNQQQAALANGGCESSPVCNLQLPHVKSDEAGCAASKRQQTPESTGISSFRAAAVASTLTLAAAAPHGKAQTSDNQQIMSTETAPAGCDRANQLDPSRPAAADVVSCSGIQCSDALGMGQFAVAGRQTTARHAARVKAQEAFLELQSLLQVLTLLRWSASAARQVQQRYIAV